MSFSRSKILLTGYLLMSAFFCGAQNSPLYDQYQYNGLAINPAFAGSREVMNIAALYRAQWLKTDGAPTTQTLAGDFPLRNPQLALGLLVINDKIGFLRNTGVHAVYAYRIKMGQGKLSLGLQGGFDQVREDFKEVKTLQSGDPMFNPELHRLFMPNVGVGAYYYTGKYFVGLSVPQLFLYEPSGSDTYKGKLTAHNVMLYGGVIVKVNNFIKLKPSTLLRYNPNNFMADVNLNAVFFPKDRVEVGISYRSTNVWGAMAEIRINPQLCIGYAYDHAMGTANITTGSHEIMLRYEFRFRVKAENPLYLQ
jgi:type IX secretion system PorP/SprF family membrane protein